MPIIRTLTQWGAVALALMGCAHAQKPETAETANPAAMTRQPVYVDDVTCVKTLKAGQSLALSVEGSLPSPAWEVADVTVTYPATKRVEVVIWAKLVTDGPVIQVIVPFTRKVDVPGLTTGRWQVEVRGHGGTGKTMVVDVGP